MSDDTDTLITLRDFIRWAASRFREAGLHFGHGTDNALDEAVTLVLHALHLQPDLPPVYLGARLTREERVRVVELLRRRLEERIPAAYLTGEAWFAGVPFYVNEHVLVPRSPIGELIERGFEPWVGDSPVNSILDLGAGSGCIGIASALRFPNARVDLVDISDQALTLARRNLERHGLEERVRLIQSDLFSELAGVGYDIILSNPPYVSRRELAGLPREYRWEPVLGLEAGDDGLRIVKRILREASGYLASGGIVIIEVGSSAEALMEHYPEVPFLWLDFERGGDGVFLLTTEQVIEYQALFNRGEE